MARRDDVSCSFCGKRGHRVRRIIAGPGGVYICNECVALCNSIIDEEERGAPGLLARTIGCWWRRGLYAASRLAGGRYGRRPSWRAAGH